MSDYPVIQVDGVVESTDFSRTGLPRGVRSVRLTSTSNPFVKRGIFKLVQLCVLLLLRTPGRDIMAPDAGGGLKAVVSRPVGESVLSQRTGEISAAVSSTETQLLSAQAGTTLEPAERLRSFTLLSATFDFENQEWLVVTRVVSDAGGAADVLL